MNDQDKEAIYDKEIAPELLRIAERCQELGLSMVSVVEYSPADRGRTMTIQEDASLGMKVIQMAAQTGERLDGLMLAISRYIVANRVPHSCIVLERMGIEPNPDDRK